MANKITRGGGSEKRPLPRVLVIVGPTSSGKTGLSLRIAKKYQGEIINADARQMYKGFSIGTGKPPGRRGKYVGHDCYMVRVPYNNEKFKLEKNVADLDKEYPEIPHYLMDFLEPNIVLTVAEWREKAIKGIKGIIRREHLPIIVGGTGLFTTALIENFSIPRVPPNDSMRQSFEKLPLDKLVDLLLKIDPTASSVIDIKNPRRVIRALEICTFTGKPIAQQRLKRPPVIDAFQIGLKWPREQLKQRIDSSIMRMMEDGWPEEVRKVRAKGLSWTAPAMTSIGYREMGMYLRGEIMLDDAIARAKQATYQYAKRQETWYKKDKKINWVLTEKQAMSLVDKWLDA